MLEILVIFLVGRHFRKRAEEAGLSSSGWAIGGALGVLGGFYGGLLLVLAATDFEAFGLALVMGLGLAVGVFFLVRNMQDKKIAEVSAELSQTEHFSPGDQGQGQDEQTF